MGWKVMKFHAVLHLAKDISMFGVPMNLDTGSNESHHKATKVAAKLTQKNIETFEEQTSNCLDDFHVLNLALEELEGRPLWRYHHGHHRGTSVEVQPQPSVTGGMKFAVRHDPTSNEMETDVITRRKYNTKLTLDQDFLSFVHLLEEALGADQGEIKVCAEHTRGGQIFRAHSNFRNKGAWQDWVNIDWGDDGVFPSQIWGFIEITKLEEDVIFNLPSVISDGSEVHNGTWAIIESCFVLGKQEHDINDNSLHSDIWTDIVLERHAGEVTGDVICKKR